MGEVGAPCGKAECEIEDLFPDDVLAVQINEKLFHGKTLSTFHCIMEKIFLRSM